MTPYEAFTKQIEPLDKDYFQHEGQKLMVKTAIEMIQGSYISALDSAIETLQERQTLFADIFTKQHHTPSGIIANTYKQDIERLQDEIEKIKVYE